MPNVGLKEEKIELTVCKELRYYLFSCAIVLPPFAGTKDPYDCTYSVSWYSSIFRYSVETPIPKRLAALVLLPPV